MAVLEGADLLDAAKLFLEGFDLGEEFEAGVRGGGGLGGGEARELEVDFFGFGEGVEEPG